MSGHVLVVPPSFAAMPRWWTDAAGSAWLGELPSLLAARCSAWDVDPDGEPMHGSNALVVPVRRGVERFALRLAPPGDDVAAEVQALRTWAGRGTVRLLDADLEARATLLERLDGGRTLGGEPLVDAVEVLAGLTRTLAVPVGSEVRSTADLAREERDRFEREWAALDAPVPRRVLDATLEAADALATAPVPDTAVDGDLHFGQVLAATRAPWLVVDPVLLRGDPEYDLGRVLWSRLDEARDDEAVLDLFDRFVRIADVPADRAARWVVVRSMSYLLRGLRRGLTIDPPRCRRLLDVFG